MVIITSQVLLLRFTYFPKKKKENIGVTVSHQAHQRQINVETTLIVNSYQHRLNVDICLEMNVEPTSFYRR